MMFEQDKVDTPSTRQLIINNTQIDPADERHHISYDKGIPDRLIFNSLSDKTLSLMFDLEAIMVIGRKRSMRDREVNVDLMELNAAELGVSRYHAMMMVVDNQIYLKDIESLNGMLLNGKRMRPSTEYVIDQGDIVAFGNLEIKVQFDYN